MAEYVLRKREEGITNDHRSRSGVPSNQNCRGTGLEVNGAFCPECHVPIRAGKDGLITKHKPPPWYIEMKLKAGESPYGPVPGKS